MKTISFRFELIDKLQKAISEDSLICSSMKRFAFKRFQEGKSNKEVYAEIAEKFSKVNCHLRNSALRAGTAIYKLNKDKKVYFGKFKKFFRGLISKEEYKESRNTGILSEGEAIRKGNRLFKIDIENNKIIWKRSAKEHYDLNLVENLSEKRKFILSKLQFLSEEKKIPVTVRVKNDMIWLSYDESLVETEKRFKNLFQNRVLGIDLNPNYFGISIIEFNHTDDYKIIHKEMIDLSKLQEQSTNKIKFELYEINHHILKLCKQWHCSKLAVEDLKFDNKKKFWNKKLNKLCKNRFRFSFIKQHLQTLCNTFGVELIEVNAAYSSIVGNFINGSETTPDPVAASIEIARRSYHKFQKGWYYPSFPKKQRLKQVLGNQWKEELKLGFGGWNVLGEKIKKLGLKYRFPLNSSNAVFSKNYIKEHLILYAF